MQDERGPFSGIQTPATMFREAQTKEGIALHILLTKSCGWSRRPVASRVVSIDTRRATTPQKKARVLRDLPKEYLTLDKWKTTHPLKYERDMIQMKPSVHYLVSHSGNTSYTF